MNPARRGLLGAGLGLSLGVGAAEPDTILVPRHEALQDAQVRYFKQLIEGAIARCGRAYRLLETPSLMVQSRALIELSQPQPGIDLFWTMTDRAREQRLLSIRIPLDRGLLGWRLLLVRRRDLGRWAQVSSASDLARLEALQMHDWPDTEILRANGLKVQTGSFFPGLFRQLALGRADYFPRSVLEIGAEAEAHADAGLVIEPQLLLHYPTALYLFVAAARPQLHADLSRGLEALVADGGFARLFEQQYGGVIERYGLRRRRLITLRNPLLPEATPLARKELWFRL